MSHLGEGHTSPHVVAIFAGIIGFVIGAAAALGFYQGKEDGMHAAMSNMTAVLQGKEGDEFDRAFLEEMIVHHQGAIVMSQMLKEKTQRPELKQFADDIISTQSKEIFQMQVWFSEWFPLATTHEDGQEH